MAKNTDNTIPQEIVEDIRQSVKRGLRVSLSNSDGRRENQDALELYQDILADLIRYREDAENFHGYAIGVTRRRIADYIRDLRATFTKLRERLRYYLNNAEGLGVRQESGEWWCGYAGWFVSRKPRASAEKIELLKSMPDKLRLRALPTGDLGLLDREDWMTLVEGILDHLDGTVTLNSLTRIAGVVLQLSEPVDISLDIETIEGEPKKEWQPVAPDPSPYRTLETRELLQQLWLEICALLPRQRAAYLLNPAEDIDIVINCGIATQKECRVALEFSDTQFALLWKDLLMSEADRSETTALADDDERFALLRKYLPIEDMLIARLLSATRNQVIGLRDCARRRLSRRMIAFSEGRRVRAEKKS